MAMVRFCASFCLVHFYVMNVGFLQEFRDHRNHDCSKQEGLITVPLSSNGWVVLLLQVLVLTTRCTVVEHPMT